MREEKVVVNVTSESKGELVIELPDGQENTYYRNPNRFMRLFLRQLQVVKTLRDSDFDQMGRAQKLTLSVVGTAELEDPSISVIGDPDSKTRTLHISFNAPSATDAEYLKEIESENQQEGEGLRYSSAEVGFNRSNWEVGDKDEWFVSCQVSAGVLNDITSAIFDGSLRGLTLVLNLRDIYSDDKWAPPSVRTKWFLRPDKADNSINYPTNAHGAIAGLKLELMSADLKDEAEQNVEQGDASEPAKAQPDPSTLALNLCADNIDKLSKMVKQVGWLTLVFLIMLLLK